MLTILDNFLDHITMYRLVLYYLIGLILTAIFLSFFGILSFSPFSLLFTTLFLLFVCYVANTIFSYAFEAPVNAESWIITALILALIITPTTSIHILPFFGFAGVLAMGSKYMFAVGKKHVFNPVAIALVIVTVGLGQSASWWVGTAWMAPAVIVGGLLVIKKIQREDLFFSYFTTALLISITFGLSRGTDPLMSLQKVILDSSLLFLGFVMLTEPLTTPPTKKMQILYGGLVGLLFSPQIHIGSIYSTPELALVVGNVFSYIVAPKTKLMLTISQKDNVGKDITDFIFNLPKKISFVPGQYMEWTLPHKNPDNRGNRRYFTLASSPTEDTVRLGVKFYENGSSYKKALGSLDDKIPLIGSQISGEFTLPKDKDKKLVFIAGGIGITPYRSILKYLIDTNQKRDIVLLYSNKTVSEIMYQDVFDVAKEKLGIKTIHTLTEEIPKNWKGEKGRIDAAMIEKTIPSWKERLFYLSGPHEMVAHFEKVLKDMEVGSKNIKIDFFPGYV